ncbi:hypothetical protein AB4Z19_27950 [Pseudoduganella sp. RAF19]|uniref:hypothetical protein n=2 Tax=unclassified Pseudoduganella TaxID=2637179 RepID=UPI003F9BA070
MKRTDILGHGLTWCALLSLLTVSAVLFNMYVDWQRWSRQDWAAWASAIGTLLAFAGTIYLARSEAKRREDLEYARMTLLVEGMRDEIKFCGDRCRYIAAMLPTIRLHWNYDPSRYKHHLESIEEFPRWSDEQLLSLIVIDSNLPWRLKRTFGTVSSAKSHLDVMFRIAKRGGDIRGTNEDQEAAKLLQTASEALAEILRQIETAMPAH